jgi:hypothetical protein
MFGLTMDDFVPQVREIMSVGEFYDLAVGGEVIFTFAPTAPSPGPRAPGRERRGGAVA